MAMPARILVIEDNEENMELMTYLLRAGGHKTLSASTGTRGIQLVSDQSPDLVLLDIQLPDVDGYEVASAIRGGGRSNLIPIVAVTALAMVGDQERIIAAGFDGYLTKPITPETFVREVEQFLTVERPGVAGCGASR